MVVANVLTLALKYHQIGGPRLTMNRAGPDSRQLGGFQLVDQGSSKIQFLFFLCTRPTLAQAIYCLCTSYLWLGKPTNRFWGFFYDLVLLLLMTFSCSYFLRVASGYMWS